QERHEGFGGVIIIELHGHIAAADHRLRRTLHGGEGEPPGVIADAEIAGVRNDAGHETALVHDRRLRGVGEYIRYRSREVDVEHRTRFTDQLRVGEQLPHHGEGLDHRVIRPRKAMRAEAVVFFWSGDSDVQV